MLDELLLVLDEGAAFPEGVRWVPFNDSAVPPSPMVRGVHLSRIIGGRLDRCPCGRYHEARFTAEGASVASWTPADPGNGEALPKKPEKGSDEDVLKRYGP